MLYMDLLRSVFHSPNRWETSFSAHHWDSSLYWITISLEDSVLLCRSLDFSVEWDYFCFTFLFDLAFFSSVIHLLFSHAIYENILNICLENGFLPKFSFCSSSCSFFLPYSLLLEILCLPNISFRSVQQTKLRFHWKVTYCENTPTNLKNVDSMLINICL